MHSGQFAERISIESLTVTRNSIGEESKTWSSVAEVWANVVTVRGAEYVAAMQGQYRDDIRVRVRYRAGITNLMRIQWRGKAYAIESVMDGGPRRDYIEMICASGVEDGHN